MKNLAELVKKAAHVAENGASVSVVNAGQKNEKWVITLDRIDKESETGNSLTIGECGLFKYGKPFFVKYNGTELEVKVKATVYISLK